MDDQRKQSPREMFVFGMLEHGACGIDHLGQQEDVPSDRLPDYGIDWEAHRVDTIAEHHAANNTTPRRNPFGEVQNAAPEQFNEVVVVPPNCPLEAAQLIYLDRELARHVNMDSTDMRVRKQIWLEGLAICRSLF
uniref:Uncharacterized protein n=1 Tax=Mycena chlorophos TaxID=658473 RepID=A0ABQ0L995_MYCCL|nr:predicted protein [Mycena chlorophos]